jgi:spermidine synthase
VKTLHRAKGLVHELVVTREEGTITLWSAAGVRHTVFDSAAPYRPGLEYARNMLAVLAFCPLARSCLVLGLGGGSIPRMLLAARPQIEVEAVEVDPVIVELAGRYFNIRALPRFSVHTEDAAVFLRSSTSRYGLIIVDTYLGEQFPDQCATREFIQDARKCLRDDGVLAVNWLSDDLQMQKELIRSLKWIVGTVWQLAGVKTDNLLYFASPGSITRSALVSAAVRVEGEIPFKNSLRRIAQRIRLCP